MRQRQRGTLHVFFVCLLDNENSTFIHSFHLFNDMNKIRSISHVCGESG